MRRLRKPGLTGINANPAISERVEHGAHSRVLITRPEPGASETAARIAALGLAPILGPVLTIVPIAPPRTPPQIAAILLPSGNAVAGLPMAMQAVRVLTVGDATARRARNAGFRDVTSADGDGAALVTLTQTSVAPGATLLLLAGRGQSLSLATRLRQAGFRVIRRVVYAAEPVPRLPPAAEAALRDGAPLTVLFFSAETARHFMRLVRAAGLAGSLRHCEAITIGAQVKWH